jgi:DNA modification methylase
MRIATENATQSRVELELYGDLLKIRALPDYRFVDRATVIVDTGDLALVGIDTAGVEKTTPELAPHLFDYQRWIVERAFDRERFAIFADTGLGKTAMQLEWARLVCEATGGKVALFAPKSVCLQTVDEWARFYPADTTDVTIYNLTDRKHLDQWLAEGPARSIGVTNYEKFDGAAAPDEGNDVAAPGTTGVVNLKYQAGDVWPVEGVILDESSMLKSFGTRKYAVMRAFDGIRYKLACSATPAPNQRTEFGQHALFLGLVRSTTEYLTAYFVNRDGDWEFKPHSFEAWVANLASWAVFVRDPARWGFADHLADLPELTETFPDVDLTPEQMNAARRHETGEQPSLFGATPGGIASRTKMMQIAHGFELGAGKIVATYPAHKPEAIRDLACDVHGDEQVIVWVTFDEEGDQLERLIPGAVHLSGKTPQAVRDETVRAFRMAAPDAARVLILKPAMFGFGVNLQSCAVQIFSTITDSFERYYQCVRRSHRFGQKRAVRIYVPLTQLDQAIAQNTMNKQSTYLDDARRLEDEVVAKLRPQDTSEVRIVNTEPDVEIDRTESETWTMVHGDCIAHLPTMAPESVDLCVFSPPFAALYAYSKALGDMGNVRADAEFRLQWRWFAERLLPVMKPGRVVAIHSKELIRFANTHGYRHCYDFPSDLRDGMVDAGFHYQRRITIWKNPQLEATRNKETSLLHVTSLRDAAGSFPQTGEYLMIFTAPGANATPIRHERSDWTFEHHTAVMNTIWPEPPVPDPGEIDLWTDMARAEAASPTVWSDIRETDVLTARTAKEHPEEKHVCPLQLGLIERTVDLWSNPGELVLSPFGGIGSEGWASLGIGRRFYGVELKESYYATACRNLKRRERELWQSMSLFDEVPA